MKKENSILIVDDEIFNLELIAISLEEIETLDIIQAQDGKDALQKVDENKIDLIVLDISMPQMNGLEVLKILKNDEVKQYIPIIMLTGKNEDKHKALELGAEDFILKPVDPLELRFKVNNLLKLKSFNDLQQFFNQRLEEELAKKEKQLAQFWELEKELSIASEVQSSLIPISYPKDNGLLIDGKCIQASEVGGDYFDVFLTDCKHYTIIVMTDISGHGFASALLAMKLRTMVRATLNKGSEDFSQQIASINHIFTQENLSSGLFATVLFLRYEHTTGILESINAGHHNPLGNINLTHGNGIPLGVFEDFNYQTQITQLQVGDTLTLFTDGILECLNSDNEMYEKSFIEHYPFTLTYTPKEQNEMLLEAFYDFITKQDDDVTILTLKKIS